MGPLLFQEERRQGSNWLPDLVCDESHFKCPVGEDANSRYKRGPKSERKGRALGSSSRDRLLPPFQCHVSPPLSSSRGQRPPRDPRNLPRAVGLALHSLGVVHLGQWKIYTKNIEANKIQTLIGFPLTSIRVIRLCFCSKL